MWTKKIVIYDPQPQTNYRETIEKKSSFVSIFLGQNNWIFSISICLCISYFFSYFSILLSFFILEFFRFVFSLFFAFVFRFCLYPVFEENFVLFYYIIIIFLCIFQNVEKEKNIKFHIAYFAIIIVKQWLNETIDIQRNKKTKNKEKLMKLSQYYLYFISLSSNSIFVWCILWWWNSVENKTKLEEIFLL